MTEHNNTASKKRVLMVHNFYQIGGGEHTVFQNEVQLLRDHGHEVVEYTRSNDELKKSKIKLVLSPLSTMWSFRTYREVKKIIKEKKIDVVHCHNTFPLISPSVYYAARKEKVPVIQTIHNFRFLCPNGTFFCDGHICELCRENGNFKEALSHNCYRNSKIQTLVVVAMLKLHRFLGTYRKINYIFLTEFNKEKFKDLIDIHGSNVFVKPNFVGEAEGDAHISGSKVFVFAGRLEENKGIKLLLERWSLLPDEFKLHIYGDGTLKEDVEKTAENASNIRYFGFQPQEVVLEDLKTACALAFPSVWYEGFPMIIAESFSVGCPVMSTNLGNQGALVRQSKGGALFEPDSEQSFLEAVETLVKENEKLSRNARAYYEQELNKESNYKRIMEIYELAK